MRRTQIMTGLLLLGIIFGGGVGCALPGNQPPVSPTVVPSQTPPPGWETYAYHEQCSYLIDHPANMDGASQSAYSWLLRSTAEDPSGPVPNFLYISVVPDDFQNNEPGVIYNYDPAEAQSLLSMQVGETRSLREDPNTASWFTYTRLPDTTLGVQAAQSYENNQPWEFPPGTKEIRYYLKGNGCTYLVGGYISTVGSGQAGAIDQVLFEQIVATFRLGS